MSNHAVCALVAGAALIGAAGHLSVSAQQSPPVLRSGVDLVTIDVQVTPAKNAPLRQLTATDFDIRISGQKRPVVSVTFLHHDEATVNRNPGSSSPQTATIAECVFGFHRKTDRPSAHYVLAVERSEAEKREVKDVKVQVVDKAFEVQTYGWRSPVRVPRLSANAHPDAWRRIRQHDGPWTVRDMLLLRHIPDLRGESTTKASS